MWEQVSKGQISCPVPPVWSIEVEVLRKRDLSPALPGMGFLLHLVYCQFKQQLILLKWEGAHSGVSPAKVKGTIKFLIIRFVFFL